MPSFRFPQLKRFGIASLLLLFVSICGGYFWMRSLRTEQFRNAVELHDFDQAEKLWKRGVRVTDDDPFSQFMRVRDRLQAFPGVQVTAWKVGKLQTINATNRYFGLLDIQESNGNQFGIGLEWHGEKWVLKTDNPQVPSYVRQSLDGGG